VVWLWGIGMRVGSIQNTDQVEIIISATAYRDALAWKRQVHWLGPAKDNSMFAFSFDHSGKVSSFASRIAYHCPINALA
jgi:hypothetical protein